jgi:hypothetical protein
MALYASFNVAKRARKIYDAVNITSDVVDAVKTYQTDIQTKIDEEHQSFISSHEELKSSSPEILTYEVPLTSPSTMPEYLSLQNELITSLSKKTDSLVSLQSFQNSLISNSLELQYLQNANIRLLSETVSTALPALVVQMQEVAKIATAISFKAQMEEASSARTLSVLESLVAAVAALDFSPNVSVAAPSVSVAAPSVSVAAPNVSVAAPTVNVQNDTSLITGLKSSIDSQSLAVTGAIGSLSSSLVNSLKSVSENAIKQKEIADYLTGSIEIKNLDGSLVATAKPIEIRTIRDAVNAKNETDEMEFLIDDDILDSLVDNIPFPEFTKADSDSDVKSILNEMGV